jgi:hypothetical protein
VNYNFSSFSISNLGYSALTNQQQQELSSNEDDSNNDDCIELEKVSSRSNKNNVPPSPSRLSSALCNVKKQVDSSCFNENNQKNRSSSSSYLANNNNNSSQHTNININMTINATAIAAATAAATANSTMDDSLKQRKQQQNNQRSQSTSKQHSITQTNNTASQTRPKQQSKQNKKDSTILTNDSTHVSTNRSNSSASNHSICSSTSGNNISGETSSYVSPYSNKDDSIVSRMEEDIKKLRLEIQQQKTVEQYLRNQINYITKCDRTEKLKLEKLQQDNDTLQAKINKLQSQKQREKEDYSSLEKRLQEEQKLRFVLEAQLNQEKKLRETQERQLKTVQKGLFSKQETTSSNCCTEICKKKTRDYEDEILKLVDECRKKQERCIIIENERNKLLKYKETENRLDTLMVALNLMENKNASLQESLSAETRFKLDLFSALGETRRQLESVMSQLENKDHEVNNLKAIIKQTLGNFTFFFYFNLSLINLKCFIIKGESPSSSPSSFLNGNIRSPPPPPTTTTTTTNKNTLSCLNSNVNSSSVNNFQSFQTDFLSQYLNNNKISSKNDLFNVNNQTSNNINQQFNNHNGSSNNNNNNSNSKQNDSYLKSSNSATSLSSTANSARNSNSSSSLNGGNNSIFHLTQNLI